MTQRRSQIGLGTDSTRLRYTEADPCSQPTAKYALILIHTPTATPSLVQRFLSLEGTKDTCGRRRIAWERQALAYREKSLQPPAVRRVT